MIRVGVLGGCGIEEGLIRESYWEGVVSSGGGLIRVCYWEGVVSSGGGGVDKGGLLGGCGIEGWVIKGELLGGCGIEWGGG